MQIFNKLGKSDVGVHTNPPPHKSSLPSSKPLKEPEPERPIGKDKSAIYPLGQATPPPQFNLGQSYTNNQALQPQNQNVNKPSLISTPGPYQVRHQQSLSSDKPPAATQQDYQASQQNHYPGQPPLLLQHSVKRRADQQQHSYNGMDTTGIPEMPGQSTSPSLSPEFLQFAKEKAVLEGEVTKYQHLINELESRCTKVIKENDKLNDRLRELAGEVEVLRGKAADGTRKVELESKLTLTQNENERLTSVLKEAREDAEVWREKYIMMEGSNRKTMTEMDNKLGFYAKEVERLNSSLVDKQKDHEVIKNKAMALETVVMERASLEAECRISKQKIVELERKVDGMNGENERVKFMLGEREKELETLKTKLRELDSVQFTRRELEKEVGFLKSKVVENEGRLNSSLGEQERLNRMLNEKLRENEQLRLDLGQLQGCKEQVAHLERELRKYSEQNMSLEEKIIQSNREMDRIAQARSQTVTELEKLKGHLTNIEKNHKREIEDLTRQVETLQKGKVEAEVTANKIFAEKTTFESQLQLVHHENVDLQGKLKHASGDLDRLSNMLREKDRDIENWRNKCFAAEKRLGNLTDLEAKVKMLEKEGEQGNTLLTERSQEIEMWKGKVNTVENELKSIRKHVIDLENKITMLLNENERLNAGCLELNHELEGGRTKSQQSEKQFGDALEAAKKEHRRLEEALSQSELQVTQARAKAVELENRVNHMINENNALFGNLQHVDAEKEHIRREMEAMVGELAQMEDLENKIVILVKENEKLNEVIRERQLEVETVRGKFSVLEANATKQEILKKELEQRLEALTKERDQWNSTTGEKGKELEQLRTRCMTLELEVRELGNMEKRVNLLLVDNERLNVALLERSKELDQLKGKLRAVEASAEGMMDVEQKVGLLVDENDRLNQALIEKTEELDRLQQGMGALEGELQKMPELMSFILLLGFENERLHNVVADLEEWRMKQSQADRERSGYINDYKGKYEAAVRSLGERERHNAELEKELMVLTQELGNLKMSFSSMRGERDRSDLMGQELDRLKRLLTESERNHLKALEDVRETKQALGAAEVDRQDTLKRMTEIEANIRKLIIENERLNKTVTELIGEREMLKTKLAVSEAGQRAEIERLKTNLDSSMRSRYEKDFSETASKLATERAIFENEVMSVNLRLKESEAKYQAAAEDIVRLEQMNLEKDGHLIALQARVKEIEDSLNEQYEDQMKNANAYIEQLEEKMKEIVGENERLNQLLAQQDTGRRSVAGGPSDGQIQQLRAIVRDLESKVTLLASENEKLIGMNNERLREIETMRHSVGSNDKVDPHHVEEIRRQVESSLKSRYEVELNALKTRHNNERQVTDNFISVLKSKLFYHDQKLVLMGMELERLEQEHRTNGQNSIIGQLSGPSFGQGLPLSLTSGIGASSFGFKKTQP